MTSREETHATMIEAYMSAGDPWRHRLWLALARIDKARSVARETIEDDTMCLNVDELVEACEEFAKIAAE